MKFKHRLGQLGGENILSDEGENNGDSVSLWNVLQSGKPGTKAWIQQLGAGT